MNDAKESKANWAEVGNRLIADTFGAGTLRLIHDPFNLNLGGHYYRPDYLHALASGQIVIVKVEETRKHRGFPTSLIKLKDAARLFPFWTFVLAVGGKGTFELEVIG